jgi:predicted O-methyltransferase YrrM
MWIRPTIFFAALILGMGGLGVYSGQQDKASEEFRAEFVKSFRRTGLNTTPEDAMLLRILVESTRAKRGVEVGSASGFGAINMGIGFERTGGKLVTIDIDPRMVKECRENVAKVGLEKTVTVVEGDALKVLPELEGEFDFVFLDAVKQDYGKYLKALSPRLRAGAVIVADNVIRSAGEMKDFLDTVTKGADYDTVIIQASQEKRDGMSVSYKVR